MRPTLSVLRGWSTDDLARQATALRTSAERLERLADALVRTVDTTAPGWTGDAASGAREAVGAERIGLLRTADHWSGAADAVGRAAQTLGELRARALRLVEAATADGLTVDDAGQVRSTQTAPDLVSQVRALVQARAYAAELDSTLNAIDTTDHDAAMAIAGAAEGQVDAPTLLAGLHTGSAPTSSNGFRIGPPDRPDITWDEDFVWGSKDWTPGDVAAKAKWMGQASGARLLRWDLGDALDAYDHYWSNSGEPFSIDYDRAADEDAGVQANIDAEVARAASGADQLAGTGRSSFSMTGPASGTKTYPQTENWQKTIGAYQQWSSADVSVADGTVTMEVTVHAEDRYNFNRGASDIASDAPDDENGRFTEIGWAKPFPTTGSVTRTVTWPVGHPESAVVAPPEQGGGR